MHKLLDLSFPIEARDENTKLEHWRGGGLERDSSFPSVKLNILQMQFISWLMMACYSLLADSWAEEYIDSYDHILLQSCM